MKKTILYLTILFFFITLTINCKKDSTNVIQKIKELSSKQIKTNSSFIHSEGKTIEQRFKLPKGFKRVQTSPDSFQKYLHSLPLKPHQSNVLYYNGKVKPNNRIYDAVVDLPIGNKNLHQCADAIIRLRAEYLWNKKQYDAIHFNFTNGFRVDYSKWMKGFRIKVKDNKAQWVMTDSPSNTKKDFWKYLETVFTYAGTLSLEKELKPVASFKNIKIGDVFIQGGSPGHAVIVVDMAVHEQTHEKIFLLAQSYMPAQEIQILQNPMNPNYSPWYFNPANNQIKTPEWTFNIQDLKHFE